MADDDWRDELPFPLSLKDDDPQTFLEITKMREAAEAKHGKETIERASREYAQMRAELQKRPLHPDRKKNLQAQTRLLEHRYGYEVLSGAPRITSGSHPVHDWRARLEVAPDEPPIE